MAQLHPAEDTWPTFPRPLEPGEQALARYLAQQLDETWDVFVHVWLNGAEVDVAAWNARHGLLLYEVKDWGEHRDLRVRNGTLFAATHRERDPVDQVDAHRRTALSPLSPLARESSLSGSPVVVAGVYLHHWSTDAARELLRPLRPAVEGKKSSVSHPIVGKDALTEHRLNEVLGALSKPGRVAVESDTDRAMIRLLTEAEADSEQREPLPLNPTQLRVARTRTKIGYRQLCGPAGSGKTAILAARAAELSAMGRRPLVITFNHTLWHWVRDMSVRHRTADGATRANHIRFCTFHDWCESVCSEAGYRSEFRDVIRQSDAYPLHEIQQLVDRALSGSALAGSGGATPVGYDDVLVDEAQDLDEKSWRLLRRAVIDGDEPGERIVAYDTEQNLYGNDLGWMRDEAQSALSGFRGRPLKLSYTYRLPAQLIPALNDFRTRFLDDLDSDLTPPEVGGTQLSLGCRLRWRQVSPEDFENEVLKVALNSPNSMDLNPADIAVLVETNDVGLRLVRRLREHEVKTKHVFGDTTWDRRSQRIAFYKGQSMLASTIHSFKGYEQRGVVLAIGPHDERRNDHLVQTYIGLSRVKASVTGGCALTVVCADARLSTWGRRWFDADDEDG